MLKGNDRCVLNTMYDVCSMGTEAVNAIMHKITNGNLALELNRQACKYHSLLQKVVEKFAKEQDNPKKSLEQKIKLWMRLNINTLKNSSTEHVAELMIRETTTKTTELMKVLKGNQHIKTEYRELAEEILNFEQKSIESLKAYLK